ncbi:hypothetical protein [Corynebacterium sp. CCM 9203]|uniref:hypothetical protein n=1 Tax=Corynebacterium sp. CCM 9203 TaxID=3057615 RepID=UPI0035252A89
MKDGTATTFEDAGTGARMLQVAVENYCEVVADLRTAARGTWSGPQVTPEELAENTGTIAGFEPQVVLDTAAAVRGKTDPGAIVARFATAASVLGEEGLGGVIARHLGLLVDDFRAHCVAQDEILAKTLRAMSANATLCRMSGEVAGVTVRATLSAIRAQVNMIDIAHGDGDWECFRELVGAAAVLVDECAREIWALCVDRDETMCEGLNHLMTGQAAVAGAPPVPLPPAAEAHFDNDHYCAGSHEVDEVQSSSVVTAESSVGASGGFSATAPEVSVTPEPCVGILGAVGLGIALISVGILVELAHCAVEECGDVACGPEPDPVAESETDTTPCPEPREVPEPVSAPVPETVPQPGPMSASEPEPVPEKKPQPVPTPEPPAPGSKHDGGFRSGEGTSGTTRKAGQW